jgi:hypothetical protein
VVNQFHGHAATRPRQHLDNHTLAQSTPISPARTRAHGSVNTPTAAPNRAVFAIHLAISLPFLAAILPLLLPITQNVTWPIPANPLECGIRTGRAAITHVKSGKNGNVHRSSQHCRAHLPWHKLA